MGKQPAWVAYVPIDFNTQSLEEVLQAAGYDPTRKTLFIWEGVTYYISAAAVGATLDFITTHSPAGSSVVFDYMPAAVIARKFNRYLDARRSARNVARKGEPWIFGIVAGQAATFVSQYGLQTISDLDPDQLAAKYLVRSDGTLDGLIASYFSIIHAQVPDKLVKLAVSQKLSFESGPSYSPLPRPEATAATPTIRVKLKNIQKGPYKTIAGIWQGQDNKGGQLAFALNADGSMVSQRIGGQDTNPRAGMFTLEENQISGRMHDVTFAGKVTHDTIVGHWELDSGYMQASFSLARKAETGQGSDEDRIRAVINRWIDRWNARDVNGVLALIHKDARIMYGGGQQNMATKREYLSILPGRMDVIGNFRFKRPSVKIDDASAVADSEIFSPIGYLPAAFHLKKEGGNWLVMRFEYEL